MMFFLVQVNQVQKHCCIKKEQERKLDPVRIFMLVPPRAHSPKFILNLPFFQPILLHGKKDHRYYRWLVILR
jgi:hypothetical protein